MKRSSTYIPRYRPQPPKPLPPAYGTTSTYGTFPSGIDKLLKNTHLLKVGDTNTIYIIDKDGNKLSNVLYSFEWFVIEFVIDGNYTIISSEGNEFVYSLNSIPTIIVIKCIVADRYTGKAITIETLSTTKVPDQEQKVYRQRNLDYSKPVEKPIQQHSKGLRMYKIRTNK